MLFYTANALPAEYRGGAFVSEHGSWDRSPLNGYRISYVAFEQGKPVGKLKAVVTGFVSDDEKELYGAPVGLAVDKTGALLIADDVGNTVWRVSANNAHGQVLGNLPVTLSLNKLRQPDRSSPQAGSSTTWSTTRKPFTCNKRLYSSGARLA